MFFEELGDNLFRIEVPLPDSPLRNLNAYLIRADTAHPGWRGRSLLIDNGFNRPECLDALLAALKKLDAPLKSLDFFITHLHADHCGLTSALLNRAGKSAWAFASPGDGTRVNMLTRRTFRLPGHFKSVLANGLPREIFEYMMVGHPGLKHATDAPCPFTPAIEGDVFNYGAFNLRVLSMPGHTPDLLCLYDKEKKILFSSDHILGDITPNIPHWDGVRDSLGNYLRSLKKTKRLDVALCLTGHRTILADCRGRIEALEKHHAARLDEVRGILKREGESCAFVVASKMTWSIRAKNWDDFPKAQKWFACSEARSHLAHLQALGEAASRRSAGRLLYRLKV